ncbi:MAG: hypothetical protein D4R67_02975 [Bacteroidetes bacterium]|nr:MAG: hypothetical protein D4R67_02975 [Bacteroidota bacterium]
MSLISPQEVIQLAYITELDPSMIKSEVIHTCELKYIKPILSPPLYEDVISNIPHYSFLISDYIQPCLAFYVKYSIMNQQLLETSQYTPGSDPNLSPVLVEVSTVVQLPGQHRRDALREVLVIARYWETLLYEYVITQNYSLYERPPARIVAGFRISKN